MPRLTFVLLAGLLVGSATPALAAYAIAFNPLTGRAVAYNGSFDLEQAKRSALANCGAGCRIVASGRKTCAAVVNAGSVWAVGFGATTSAATNVGTLECKRKGGVVCRAAAAICD